MRQEVGEDRILAWEACYNAREIGGYPTEDDRRTRWRALVRTDNLYRLTPEGQAALRDYGVRTVIDLRFAQEIEREANPFAEQQVSDEKAVPRYFNLPVIDPDDEEAKAATAAAESMLGEYIIILESSKERIAAVIKAVAAGLQAGGVLVHCHGGKDRTGIIVALLLSLVGVPREIIIEDYAMSEIRLEVPHSAWLEKQIEARGEPMERPRWMYSLPETMQGTLEYLDKEYGGPAGYLGSIGVAPDEMEAIREHLLAPKDDPHASRSALP
jgi:protein tyrosine/serine phosphatase